MITVNFSNFGKKNERLEIWIKNPAYKSSKFPLKIISTDFYLMILLKKRDVSQYVIFLLEIWKKAPYTEKALFLQISQAFIRWDVISIREVDDIIKFEIKFKNDKWSNFFFFNNFPLKHHLVLWSNSIKKKKCVYGRFKKKMSSIVRALFNIIFLLFQKISTKILKTHKRNYIKSTFFSESPIWAIPSKIAHECPMSPGNRIKVYIFLSFRRKMIEAYNFTFILWIPLVLIFFWKKLE